jgi:tRNA-splicing ligase RtcB
MRTKIGQVAADTTAEVMTVTSTIVEPGHHAGAPPLRQGRGSLEYLLEHALRRGEEAGIIPGSMGARSYIVRGLGNPESFESCGHGAGRVMSRAKAKKLFAVKDQIRATEGVECRKDKDVIGEFPMAHRDIDAVMEGQKDLVEVVDTLK